MEYAKFLLKNELDKCNEDLVFLDKQQAKDPGTEISKYQLKKKIEDLTGALEKLDSEVKVSPQQPINQN